MTEGSGSPHGWSRLVLVGFMGAGKTTVGSLLAARLALPFLDSDTIIEQQTGKTIARLFEQLGEDEFRLIEARAITTLLGEREVVIALGGGSLENPATRRLLSESAGTCVIHLEAPLATMLERCRVARSGLVQVRPLLDQDHALAERHHRRLRHYRAAGLTIDTEGLTPEAVVEHLLQGLKPGFQPPLPKARLIAEAGSLEARTVISSGLSLKKMPTSPE